MYDVIQLQTHLCVISALISNEEMSCPEFNKIKSFFFYPRKNNLEGKCIVLGKLGDTTCFLYYTIYTSASLKVLD